MYTITYLIYIQGKKYSRNLNINQLILLLFLIKMVNKKSVEINIIKIKSVTSYLL